MYSENSKKILGSEYSTEKGVYVKPPELNSISSKRGSTHTSAHDSVRIRKDEYALYIDRPFNSIDGKF